MRTIDHKCDRLHAMLESYGKELGLPIPIRVIASRLVISDYVGGATSFSQSLAEGRRMMDAIASDYDILEKKK